MTLRKFLFIVSALFVLLASAVGLASINHPIILKWVTGSARHHGQPIPATVYANGQVNNDAGIYYTDDENTYLLSLMESDSSAVLEIININLNEKWIGTPVAMSRDDYDLIARHLFQSETGVRFIPFQDNIKGFNFDPHLTFTNQEIKFSLPRDEYKFDSVRIQLP